MTAHGPLIAHDDLIMQPGEALAERSPVDKSCWRLSSSMSHRAINRPLRTASADRPGSAMSAPG
jgi:hypothetical protein